ncbi:MAG TPA: fumarylacetoacetate hydrolase family protein [Bryocella sp.]|nr:fumarylacetoacetate hydrolase family protein [Bryocella sp.]
MKLTNIFNAAGERVLALVEGDRVYDLSKASGNRPEFASLGKWLHAGEPARSQADKLREQLARDASAGTPLSDAKLAPMVDCEARIFCVGLNYADHAAENNLPPPESPIFFTKLTQVVVPHGAEIPLPAISKQVDYEAEVAVILGRRADRVSEEEAEACVAGYSIMNDVSARDLQRQDKQWFRGKSCNAFGPLGPWMVTLDAIADPKNMEVTLRYNGKVLQHSNTKNLVFTPPALISILSETLVLEPGDVLSTGTPAGIGFHQKPQVFMQPGDRVEIEVEGVGVLENTFVAESPKR